MVLVERDRRFTLPGLPGDETGRRSHRAGHRRDDRYDLFGSSATLPGKRLEGEHDQGIPCQDRQRFAERAMDRRSAAPPVGVVEAGQIVVNQRGTMEQFDGACGSEREGGGLVPLSPSDGEAQLRPNPGTPGKDGVSNRTRQPRRSRLLCAPEHG